MLVTVYAVDVEKLEARWRSAIGARARDRRPRAARRGARGRPDHQLFDASRSRRSKAAVTAAPATGSRREAAGATWRRALLLGHKDEDGGLPIAAGAVRKVARSWSIASRDGCGCARSYRPSTASAIRSPEALAAGSSGAGRTGRCRSPDAPELELAPTQRGSTTQVRRRPGRACVAGAHIRRANPRDSGFFKGKPPIAIASCGAAGRTGRGRRASSRTLRRAGLVRLLPVGHLAPVRDDPGVGRRRRPAGLGADRLPDRRARGRRPRRQDDPGTPPFIVSPCRAVKPRGGEYLIRPSTSALRRDRN